MRRHRPNPQEIKLLMAAAMGKIPADMVIQHAKLVNVYTGEVLDDTTVCVKGKWIAHVGKAAPVLIGTDTKVIDAAGKVLAPGFIDGHTHMVWLFSIPEFIRYAAPGGTTAVVAETMEAYPVAGIDGVLDVMASFADQPIKIFGTAPTMVSTSRAAAGVAPEDLERILSLDDVVGLGESYWQAVLQDPDRYLPEMAAALDRGKTLEGHSAGAKGGKLSAYLSTGVSSCHEPITAEEVLGRIRLGMHVMIREGSIRRDLAEIAAIRELSIDTRRLILCTDGISPGDLLEKGYMEYVVQKAIDSGFDPVTAIQMATVNVAEHFRIDGIVGGIAPGKCADMVLLPALEKISPEMVISNGQVIAENGTLLVEPRVHRYTTGSRRTIHLSVPVAPDLFAIACDAGKEKTEVRVIEMISDLVSKERHLPVSVHEGRINADAGADLLKVSAVDRAKNPGKVFTGLIRGFGLKNGALAASSAWDTSDIIAVGASDQDMAGAVNRVCELQGGAVLCVDGSVVEEIPMPVLGIISDLPMEELVWRQAAMNRTLAELGCTLADPLLTLVILTGAAIPFFRICEEGLVDFKTGETVGIFVNENANRF
ncbi:MAG: amidohydrolase family protein [Desulfobacterales bacterium]|nr:amidohydrolase family protein [Desulfobacterales bacterium]